MTSISVIVPVYNSKNHIEKCIQSLLVQSYKDWELILVDDGSTDGSEIICDMYSDNDKRIRTIHKNNGGVSDARNVGIEYSTGDRIMFLDSDDTLEPNTFEELSHIIDQYDYDVICWALKTNQDPTEYCSMSSEVTCAQKGNIEQLEDLRLRAFSGWSNDNVKDKAMAFIVTKLIKREIITNNNLKFNIGLKYHEDTMFCIETLHYAQSIIAINKFYYIRTIHEKSASVSYNPNINDFNMLSIELFSNFVESYYSSDERYKIAMEKFKLGWFLQCLELDYLNSNANYTQKQRISYIRTALQSGKYAIKENSILKELKIKQRIFAYLINNKCGVLIYIIFKLLNR